MTYYDRVRVTTVTTGNGTIVLGSAVSGFQNFANVTNNSIVTYVIEDGTSWETGTGTYFGSNTSLSRTPIFSSNSNTALNLSGSASVFLTPNATDLNTVFNTATGAFSSANSAIKNNATTLISTGYTTASFNAGIFTGTTWTPDPANGNYQWVTSNGTLTIATPTSNTAITFLLINGSNANTLTFSSYTVSASVGDTYAVTNANKYLISINRINNISTYIIKALQ